MYICIIGAWFIFISLNHTFDKNILGVDGGDWISVIKEYRGGIFTTIFIAFLINSINHISEYKKILRYQYFVYINTMLCFDSLFLICIRGI